MKFMWLSCFRIGFNPSSISAVEGSFLIPQRNFRKTSFRRISSLPALHLVFESSCSCTPYRFQSSNNGENKKGFPNSIDKELEGVFGTAPPQLSDTIPDLFGVQEQIGATDGSLAPELMSGAFQSGISDVGRVFFHKMTQSPPKFDVLAFTSCYVWRTTAKFSRKVHGPMREWADEVKFRTGVHLECEPAYPDKVVNKAYGTPDDVEMNIYAFGTDRAVMYCAQLLESVISHESAYIRCGIFRRSPECNNEVEWLTLRRINSELRPPDIPAISLKLTGTYTLLFENFKEAVIRSVWEETGISLNPLQVYPSGLLINDEIDYYWRPQVRYFVAEFPEDADVRAPLPSMNNNYFLMWDNRLLSRSPDPIDQAWVKYADRSTGLAWMPSAVVDELQKPLRGERYLSVRYTPPPYSNLQGTTNLPALEEN